MRSAILLAMTICSLAAPLARACSCVPLPPPPGAIPARPTCQGQRPSSDTHTGFIGEVVEAETPEDRFEEVLKKLPRNLAARVRHLQKELDDSESQDEHEAELSEILVRALTPADQRKYHAASKVEKDRLLDQLWDRPLHFRLRVLESQDAQFHGEVVVVSGVTSCGLHLKEGEVWHLKPSPDEKGDQHVGVCGGNRQIYFLESAQRHRQAVRQGSPESRIEGTVSVSYKEPLVAARVEAKSGDRILQTNTDQRGAFEFPTLPPGKYELRVLPTARC